jgi:hypothetical protein
VSAIPVEGNRELLEVFKEENAITQHVFYVISFWQ